MSLENQTEKEKRHIRIREVEAIAINVFGSTSKAKAWMVETNVAFGRTPLSMLNNETGAREVKKVLASIAYGGTA